MLRRDIIILFFSAIILLSGFLFLSKISLASFDNFIELINHDGIIENNLSWNYINCSTTTAEYIILKTSSSELISPEIDLPFCTSAILDFQARTYGGEKYNSSTNGTTSDIFIKIKSGEIEENILSKPVAGNVMSSTASIDLTKYCGNKLILSFNSYNATSSIGFGLDNIKIKYQPIINNQLPVANAGPDKEAIIDELVAFDGSESNDSDGFITDWSWDFGSFQLLGVTTSYAFNVTGTYQVSLMVTDDQGATSSPDYIIINVKDREQTSSTASSTTSTIFAFGDVLINELLPAPTSGNKEWIELYNNTDKSIDLSGWLLLNKEGSKYSTTTLSGIIDPDDFFVIENIIGNLNNSGDEIILKDYSGKIISQTSYGDFSSCYDCAWARNDIGDYLLTITPTKNAVNIITSKIIKNSEGSSNISNKEIITTTTQNNTTTTTQKDIYQVPLLVIINEIYPNPNSGQEEFIEFRNLDTKPIDISGLVIADASKKKFKIASSTILSAGGYAVFIRSQSNIALNNSGLETIFLSYPDGSIIDKVSYSGSKKGKSFSRKDSGEWQWSDVPTPAQENIFSLPAEELPIINLSVSTNKMTTKKVTTKTKKIPSVVVSSSLDQVRELDNGSRVKVSGVVSVVPGVLGAQIFYLAGSGIQIYSYNKTFPNLTLGDRVEIIGELSESGGERRIKISSIGDIKILGHDKPPEPHQISTADLGENYEGWLVMIEGDVLEKKGRNIYIDDGSGAEAKAYIKSHIAIEDLTIKEGDKIKLIGIVSKTSSGYRILPRSIQDIEIIKGEVKGEFETASFNFTKEYYLFALIIFLAAIIIWLIYKWPNKKTSK